MKGFALRRVGMRVTAQAGPQQALRDPVAQVPAVKPVGVFLQVELASGASAPVIGAVNKGLGQADDGVHPVEDLRCLGVITMRHPVVRLMRLRPRRVDGSHVAQPNPIIFDPPELGLMAAVGIG